MTMMDTTQENFDSSSSSGGPQQPSGSPSVTSTSTAEKNLHTDRDHQHEESNQTDDAYRLVNYGGTRRDSDGDGRQREYDLWDEILDIHHQSIEGRDDNDDAGAWRRSGIEHGTLIVQRKLLQRRNVWKLQKERSLSAASRRTVATSPIHKRASASSSTPHSALTNEDLASNSIASPCEFHTKRRPNHSPIRPCQNGSQLSIVLPGGKDRDGLCKSGSIFFTSASARGCDNHCPSKYYPQMSPVRCSKRRKIFSTSRTTDCTA